MKHILKLLIIIFLLFLKSHKILNNNLKTIGNNKDNSQEFEKLSADVFKNLYDCSTIDNCLYTAERASRTDSIKNILNNLFNIVKLYLNRNSKEFKLNDQNKPKNKNQAKILNSKNIFSKDIEDISSIIKKYNYDCFSKSLKEVMNIFPNLSFYIYSIYYGFVNWMLKTNNFKQTAINKSIYPFYPDTMFKNQSKINNNKTFNSILNFLISIFKTISSYIYKYSTEKVANYNNLYRGVLLNKDNKIFNCNKHKSYITSPNPLSFSFDENVAKSFLYSNNKNRNNKNVLFVIKNSQYCLGKEMNSVQTTNFVNEKEFLLRPFTKLELNNVTKVKDTVKLKKYTKIELSCLPSNYETENKKMLLMK